MTPADMKALCAASIDRLLADFESQPDPKGFFDLGAAAEMLVLCGGIPSTKPLRDRLSTAALGWVRREFLDDAMFAKAEYLYHSSLFCYLASQAVGFEPEDLSHPRRILQSGLAGRNELPVITLQLVSTCLAAAGIELGSNGAGTRNLRLVIDRRVLRPRTDEYDVLTLTMVAQIFKLGGLPSEQLPRLFPQALLVQALRQGHTNWIAPLTLLCGAVYGMPDWLREGATSALASSLANASGLVPPPEGRLAENDYVQRAETGLRIRSSIALFALFHD
jgi:hypothetical protein